MFFLAPLLVPFSAAAAEAFVAGATAGITAGLAATHRRD